MLYNGEEHRKNLKYNTTTPTKEMIDMTMVPIWKICPKCKKKYDWNPDVGRMTCPYCLRKEQRKTVLGRIFRKKKNGDRDGDGSPTSKN